MDVAVTCPTNIRLVNITRGSFPASVGGRLEVLKDGVWGTVCARNFDRDAVYVACRHLGLPTYGSYCECAGRSAWDGVGWAR